MDPRRGERILRHLARNRSLAESTALVEGLRLLDAEGVPVRWDPATMVAAASPALRERIDGPELSAAVEAAREACAVAIAPSE
jgi:hypothetical protein